MQRPLTDALLRQMEPPASGRIEIGDARCIGLVFRITKAGARSFSFRFRARDGAGVQRVTLGNYPTLGLGKARTAADAMRATVQAGGDPAAERREQRTGGRAFAKLTDKYLEQHARRKKRASSVKADERNLRLHILPRWRHRDYLTIRRADAIELVEGLIADGKQTLANRVQALVSKIFSFAVDASLRDDNPCARMERRGVERVRKRVLSDSELRLFWPGIIQTPATRRTGLGLRLALLTGARVSEIAGLSRVELQNIESEHSAAWLIPGERTKNGQPHLVPLAPLARETVLDLLAMIEPGEQFLFPTRSRKRKGPIRGNTLTQAMDYFSERDHGGAGDTWGDDTPTPHSLRKTLETRLASIGIAKETRDRCLNHLPRDVGSVHYNFYDYVSEKRNALGRWEALLGTILHGGGVVIPLVAVRA
jgi:integrase